ncbi:MAG: glycine cleavage system protein R [Beutenbergiaceae bacterium]
MRQLILTVIGDDRAGLVAALADVVQAHGGTWEFSEMAELAGTFAGVVQVAIPAENQTRFIDVVGRLDLDLEVRIRAAQVPEPARSDLRIELIADDQPGLVQQVSSTLAELGVGISRLETSTQPAPMAGGQLFVLRANAVLPPDVSRDRVRVALENLSQELMVDLSLAQI